MPVDVRLPTVLRQYAAGQATVKANGETIREVFEDLVLQFPQLQGPTERFFEVPATVKAPGLVVVLAGDWKP